MRVGFVVILLMIAATASAGSSFPVALSPAKPTALTPVLVSAPGLTDVAKRNDVIEIRLGRGPQRTFRLGMLPAGRYMLRAVDGTGVVRTTTFTVADPAGAIVPPPALSRTGIMALSILIVGTALSVLNRAMAL